MDLKLSKRVKDLTGQRFGKLTVVCLSGYDKWYRAIWQCQCDCGQSHNSGGRHLKTGNIQSCGCLLTTHGHSSRTLRSPTYISWQAMKNRSTNPKHAQYKDYGSRGITVCDRWQGSFENFLADMGERPKGLTLDRIENDKGYEPGNCRWATRKEQRANRRQRRGETMPNSKLSDEQVIAIRNDPRSSIDIAEDYPVDVSRIRKIKRGVAWSHVE